ncbi:MAG: hypothetical protein F6J98_42375 [Moorea sp. SIO4G2]|nr:hypothetical protein [Moorena sp. SIO4G2]
MLKIKRRWEQGTGNREQGTGNRELKSFLVSICATRTLREQPSAVSRELKAHATRTAFWHRLLRWDFTQIKPMLTCCLDAVAHGGNHGSRSWGEPPRPRCLPCSLAASLIQKLRAES